MPNQLKSASRQSSIPVAGGVLRNSASRYGGLKADRMACDGNYSIQLSTRNSELETGNFAGVPPIVREVLRSPGQPLALETRAFFEPRFGHHLGNFRIASPSPGSMQRNSAINASLGESEQQAESLARKILNDGHSSNLDRLSGSNKEARDNNYDFSRVRIHADRRASTSAATINALAYTSGNHVVFGPGQFAPHTDEGRRLLAHELSHVVQQSANGTVALQRFEAPKHKAIEHYALTTDEQGRSSGLSLEEASAVYFGNWMRDLNQIFVPMLINMGFDNETIFAAASYLAAKEFGRVMTPEEFGYYIPAEHIDNPAGLVKDDDLLPGQPAVTTSTAPPTAVRPPEFVTEQESVDPVEGTVLGANIFSVDKSGVMAFIRRTNLHVEKRLELAALRKRTPEGMIHFGAALHSVEDLFAHSNWIEIALSKVLREKKDLLPQVSDASKQIFNYSTSVEIGKNKSGKPEYRPVLTTGSFTGADTQISLASEFVSLLLEPLPDPKTDAEGEAEKRFTLALLKAFDGQLKNNPEFRQATKTWLETRGVPEGVADEALKLPLTEIYLVTTWFTTWLPSVKMAELLRIPIQRFIRSQLSIKILQPLGKKIQAQALEKRVADTSLIKFYQDSKRKQAGKFTKAEQVFFNAKAQLGGSPVPTQQEKATAEASRHAEALEATPEPVIAGPSHSQISKDHSNSPFFALAFKVATVAVRMLRDKMLRAWDALKKTATTAFDFGFKNWPPAAKEGASEEEKQASADARALFHTSRDTHRKEGSASFELGLDVNSARGEFAAPYDLAAMRKDSANRVRIVAAALRAAGNTLDSKAEDSKAELIATADKLDTTASLIENSVSHKERERNNQALVMQRQEALTALAGTPGVITRLASAALRIIDEAIAVTAVSYTSEQRKILEGYQLPPGDRDKQPHVPGLTAPKNLMVMNNLELPDLAKDAKKQPAVVDLLQESRNIITHPYEGTWWVDTVTNHVASNPKQIAADIEARNEGVAVYRRSGEHHSAAH